MATKRETALVALHAALDLGLGGLSIGVERGRHLSDATRHRGVDDFGEAFGELGGQLGAGAALHR